MRFFRGRKGAAPPEWIAVKSFGSAILLGALLLMIPLSSSSGSWTNPLDALFTSASATCVTGLIVVDTGTYFSSFGHAVILSLIQLGGLGIMTLATFLLVAVGRRLSIQHEKVFLDTTNGCTGSCPGKSILLMTVIFTILVELVGATILALRFYSLGFDPGKSIKLAVFHSISAFCNAGFSLFEDSLVTYREDPVILLTVSSLIILGGLGFLVVYNIFSLRPWRRNLSFRGRLSFHSKVVLLLSGALTLLGWLLFAVLEWNGTLEPLSFPGKMLVSFLQAVTPRTAGFNAVDISCLSNPSKFMTIMLMFIGGGSGSTAGGIKVTTAFVLGITLYAMIRGRDEPEFLDRAISMRIVREAVSISVMSIISISLFYWFLLMAEENSRSCRSRGRSYPDGYKQGNHRAYCIHSCQGGDRRCNQAGHS